MCVIIVSFFLLLICFTEIRNEFFGGKFYMLDILHNLKGRPSSVAQLDVGPTGDPC